MMYALSCNIYISWVRIFVRMKFRMPLFVIILLTFRHKLSSCSHLQRLGFYGGTTLHALSMVLELIYLMAIFISTLDYLFFLCVFSGYIHLFSNFINAFIIFFNYLLLQDANLNLGSWNLYSGSPPHLPVHFMTPISMPK